MSERKVLNKYYPPEFDPSKIPKLKQGKNRTFSIRIMAPFNMRCHTCGEYIYKGKKFNSRKENVDDEDYLGLRIFRFYIKCPRCVAEIAFKTDLANTDYALEAGATRLFEAEKLAHQMAERERKEKEEDELNPMKMLENRTKASRNEMEQIDQLDELREINARHARVEHAKMLDQHMAYEEQLLKLQEEEEDKMVQAILKKGHASDQMIRRIDDTKEDEDCHSAAKKPRQDTSKTATDVLTDSSDKPKPEAPKPKAWERSVGTFSKKTSLAGLVKRKTPAASTASSTAPKPTTSTCTSDNSERIPSTSKDAVPPANVFDKSASQPGPSSKAVETASGSSTGASQPSGSGGGLGALGMLGGYSDSESDQSD